MSGGPVQLSAVRLKPVPEVVAMLEDILKRAESGEIRGFVFSSVADRRCVATCFERGDGSIADLYYATGIAQRRLLEWEDPE